MNYTLKNRIKHLFGVRLELLVLLSWLGLAVNGQMLNSGWGWLSYPPQVASLAKRGQRGQRRPSQKRLSRPKKVPYEKRQLRA